MNRTLSLVWLVLLISSASACTGAQDAPPPLTQTPAVPTLMPAASRSPITSIVWPTLETVEPTGTLAPGTRVKVTARGGYLTLPGGGVNESARNFDLFWDDKPIARLGCYVNHCEAQFPIPADASPGAHRLSTEGASALTVQVR